ncbi:MAG: hypothetical protein K8R21_00280 [Leptospira sp.]|nr:hypothetical protein [Leptospira sp.]
MQKSETEFRSLKAGDSVEKVLRNLGKPIFIYYHYKEGAKHILLSFSGDTKKAIGADRIQHKEKGILVYFPTDDLKKEFQSQSIEQIRQNLGNPVYEIWAYSDEGIHWNSPIRDLEIREKKVFRKYDNLLSVHCNLRFDDWKVDEERNGLMCMIGKLITKE